MISLVDTGATAWIPFRLIQLMQARRYGNIDKSFGFFLITNKSDKGWRFNRLTCKCVEEEGVTNLFKIIWLSTYDLTTYSIPFIFDWRFISESSSCYSIIFSQYRLIFLSIELSIQVLLMMTVDLDNFILEKCAFTIE